MKISLITPSFNRAYVIQETADSIFAQTFENWEWIIVDDGSTDNSWEKLKGYAQKDSRVKVFRRDREPKGAAACRNIAIEKSTGEYLLFIDTDDIMASFCLEQRASAAKNNPEVDFWVFQMMLFKKKIDDTRLIWNIENDEDDTLRLLYLDPIIAGSGTLWKKKSFIGVGMWDEKLALWQDVELHLRSLLKGVKFRKYLQLPPDIFVRSSDDSVSRANYNSMEKLNSRVYVLSSSLINARGENKLEKYKSGFKNLAKTIYLGAVLNKTKKELRPLWKVIDEFELFSDKEKKILKRYKFFNFFKLYKIKLLNKIMLSKLQKIAPAPEKLLLSVRYEKDVLD